MYFDDLHSRLIDLARRKVREGTITERGLARLSGISQPHMHNVLKNKRAFSDKSADRLLSALQMQASDLFWQTSGEAEARVRAIPMVRSRIGPGTDASLSTFSGYVPMPDWLSKGLVDPVLARLSPDLVLPKTLAAQDLVLLDCNPVCRASPGVHSIWIVKDRSGMRARYVRKSGDRLYIANEANLKSPEKWQAIVWHGSGILDAVQARIAWISRELDKENPADGA